MAGDGGSAGIWWSDFVTAIVRFFDRDFARGQYIDIKRNYKETIVNRDYSASRIDLICGKSPLSQPK